MRGRVIVTTLSPAQLAEAMTVQARAASAEIQRLASVPLAPGETCVDRALETARHALALADAWEILETLAIAAEVEIDSPSPVSPADGSGVNVSRKGETVN
jgi:hypothetical protein